MVNTKDRVKCQLTVFFLLKPDDAASVDISNPCNTATQTTGLFCCRYSDGKLEQMKIFSLAVAAGKGGTEGATSETCLLVGKPSYVRLHY